VLYRVTELVCEEGFGINEIDELASYPEPEPSIIQRFGESLGEAIPEIEDPTYSVSGFYTIKNTNWGALGLRNAGNAKLRLVSKDMNVLTITALIFDEIGKDYNVYVGDRDVTLQMIAHELCAAIELNHFLEYFREQRANVDKVKEAAIAELDDMLAPLFHIFRKHRQWNSVKSSLRSLLSVQSTLVKGDLLVQALEKIVEGRFAYFNVPQQIWLVGKEPDDQEKVQYLCNGFFEARLEGGKITKLSEKPSKPGYAYLVDELRNEIEVLHENTATTLSNEKDLLTAFQTEFSLYAVWLAVIALLISLVSIVITISTGL
jgi:hypothetical protein